MSSSPDSVKGWVIVLSISSMHDSPLDFPSKFRFQVDLQRSLDNGNRKGYGNLQKRKIENKAHVLLVLFSTQRAEEKMKIL